MKQENIIALIKELFAADSIHESYTDNNLSYTIDTQKKDNVLNIKITLKENKDKLEFQNWVDDLDDELFNEAWESLSETYGLQELNEEYESGDYKKVINLFKNEIKKILSKKIEGFNSILGKLN